MLSNKAEPKQSIYVYINHARLASLFFKSTKFKLRDLIAFYMISGGGEHIPRLYN